MNSNVNVCDRDCRSKCWADYVETKNSIFGKIVVLYIVGLLTLSNYLLNYYNKKLFENFKQSQNTIMCLIIDWNAFVIKSLYFYVIITYLYCVFKDPGYINENIKKPENIEIQKHNKFCKKCQSWKPNRAYHCKRCEKCVFKMDHHCYFINNCVGVRNQKSYILFLVGMLFFIIQYFISCYFVSGLLYKTSIYKFNKFGFFFWESLSLFILLHGCYFFPYIYNLLKKSLTTIFQNQTEVEQVKNIQGQKMSMKQSFNRIFGENIFFIMNPIPNLENENYLEETDQNMSNINDIKKYSEFNKYFLQLNFQNQI